MALLRKPNLVRQNTTASNDGADDCYPFACLNGRIIADPYNNLILWIERQNGGSQRILPLVSGSNGHAWTEPDRTGFFDASGEGALNQRSVAYDSVNDLMHVLWNGDAVTDGIIYRRYSFTRDLDNRITDVTRVSGINLQLDFQGAGTMGYAHPGIIWIPEGGANGSILCVWNALNTAGSPNKVEVRASMRVLSNTSADNTAANWTFPVTNDSTGIGNAPAVAYSIIATGNYDTVPHTGIARKAVGTNALDVYCAYHDGNSAVSKGTWKFRRLRWNGGANKWSTGLSAETTLSVMQVAGTDTGYTLKYQLMTQVVEDTVNDQMYVGFPVWKSNADGDTSCFFYINANDTISARIDVASAGGAHSYAPTMDLMYDTGSQQLVVAYEKSSDGYFYYQVYDNDTQVEGETPLFTGTVVDVPVLHSSRFIVNGVDARLIFITRDRVGGSPPYRAWFGYADFAPTAGDSITPTIDHFITPFGNR